MLPEFISERYALYVRPAPTVQIASDDGLVRIGLSDDAAPDGSSGRICDLSEAASGYQVWLELALREAASRVDLCARALEGIARVSADHDDAATEAVNAVELILQGNLAGGHIREATRAFVELDRAYWEDYEDEPALFEWGTSRVYLIDEPEQRLHPALQRRAAAWLASFMDQQGTQCILATHSSAFIDSPGDVVAYEVLREGDNGAVREVDLKDFGPHSQIARSVGLDRGELLARWRAFLFVEGEADLAVIETLFGERLRASKILVQPVDGHRHHAGLLEMRLLLREIATPVAAMFDGIDPSAIEEIRRSRDARNIARKKPDERGTVARIVEAELSTGHQVEILTIKEPDILDVLDEEAIRRTFGGRFPGHHQAREAFGRAGGGNAATRKDFYKANYGISFSPVRLRDVAREMVKEEATCPALEQVIDQVDQLANKRAGG